MMLLKTAGCIAGAILLGSCCGSNNLLLGRVENTVGTHKVVVTDCYRTSVPRPEQLPNGGWRWTPCRDADIRIDGGQLQVNGRDYGKIGARDSVLVDHGVVSVNKD